MIQVTNITKRYGHLMVLDQVSLAIAKGELVAITGPSGAGKSTLLHIMGSLDKADSGSVQIQGTNILGLPAKAQSKFRNEKIGFIFQFHHLLPEFSAIENVAMPLWIKKQDYKTALQKAQELLNQVGLQTKSNNKPSELSGGEQQRVAIARALANNPEILMADEPTGNLDSNNAQSIHELFRELSTKYGHTIVLVTHNQDLAALADRNIQMKDGKIVVA